MVANLIAEINEYEDTTDDDYSPVTLYLIKISFQITGGGEVKISNILRKRYSEFSKLYNSLRPKFAKLENYRFPNKSMFNSQSTFTKDRRRQGFDEFVKLLVQLMPESEISEFFELERQILESKKNMPSNAKLQLPVKAKTSFVDDKSSSGGTEMYTKPKSKDNHTPVIMAEKVNEELSTSSLTKLFVFNILPSSTAVV